MSLVQVIPDDQLSDAAWTAASRMGLTGRLMHAVRRELQGRDLWSTDSRTRLTIRIVDVALRPEATARVGADVTRIDRLAVAVVVETNQHLIKTYPVETHSTSDSVVEDGPETRVEQMLDQLANLIVTGY